MKRILLLALILLAGLKPAKSQYWQPVASGTKGNLLSVSFGSQKVGYISGTDSLLLRTVDGGLSWKPVAHNGLLLGVGNPDIIHVNFLSADTGFAIIGDVEFPIYRGILFKTTDSGKTWTSVMPGNIAAARTYFFDAGNGYVIGSAFFAGYTVIQQSGGIWGHEKMFSYNPREFLYGIDFRNKNTGIVGGHGGLVYRTFDGGNTWDTVKTIVDSAINDLKFLSDRTILAGSDNDGAAILISHDTGRTWNLDMSTLTFAYPDIKGLAVSKRDSFIAIGHASFATAGIIIWQDGAFANNFATPQRLNAIAMRDDSVAYIVGDSGTIYTNRSAVLDVANSEVSAMELRVFPNPANDIFYTESVRLHTLRIYDALGRLVDEKKQPANSHAISVASLSAGIYVIQAIAENGTAVVRKVVLE